MATIDSQDVIDELLAHNGVYPGDEDVPQGPVVRIVRYTTPEGNQTHGIVYACEIPMGLLHRYEQVTAYVLDPVVIFSREP